MPLTREQKRSRNRIYKRRYQAKHPGRHAALERERRQRSQTPQRRRRETELALERKKRRQEAQAGRPKPDRCEACGRNGRPLQFDHCHNRGLFRGWLCVNCNAALGHVNDSADHLQKLIDYLKRTKLLVVKQMAFPF